MKDKNYYDILCIPKYSGIEDIRTAYKKAVKYLHPDANIGKPKNEVERKKAKFEEIQRIYDELSDPEKKKAYDSKLLIESQHLTIKSKFKDESWGKF